MIPPIVGQLVSTMDQSVNALFARIANVADGPGCDELTFYIGQQKYLGRLRGNNRDYVLGFGSEHDRRIALRVYLAGDAVKAA